MLDASPRLPSHQVKPQCANRLHWLSSSTSVPVSVISLQKLGLIWAPAQMMEKNQHVVKGFGWAWVYDSGSCAGTQLQANIWASHKECYTDFKRWSHPSSFTPRLALQLSPVITDKLCWFCLYFCRKITSIYTPKCPQSFRSSSLRGTSYTSQVGEGILNTKACRVFTNTCSSLAC